MNNLMSDYIYLEDIDRRVNIATRENDAVVRKKKNVMFVKMARAKTITVTIMFDECMRHSLNQSHFIKSTNCIMWTVEVLFNDSTPITLHKYDNLNTIHCSISEMTTLADIMTQADISNAHLYIKIEGTACNTLKYAQLVPSMTLNECLIGRMIYEYPSIIASSVEYTRDRIATESS